MTVWRSALSAERDDQGLGWDIQVIHVIQQLDHLWIINVPGCVQRLWEYRVDLRITHQQVEVMSVLLRDRIGAALPRATSTSDPKN
jgi:hypothetical protein